MQLQRALAAPLLRLLRDADARSREARRASSLTFGLYFIVQEPSG